MPSSTEKKRTDFSTVSQIYSKRPTWEGDTDDDDDEEEVEFMKKSGLNKLDLADNHFVFVPAGLPCLAPNLSKLNLRKNKITEIDSVSLFPEHLTSLDLSENKLLTFNLNTPNQDTVNDCYALVRKSAHPRVRSKPRRIFCHHRKHKQLFDVTRLILSNNQLEYITLNLSDSNNETNQNVANKQKSFFPELKTFDVSNNRLSKVPTGIGKLSKLCSLTLGCNPGIDVLPSEMGLCSELYELRIEGLQLKDPPKNILEKLTTDGRRDIRSLTGYLKSLHDK